MSKTARTAKCSAADARIRLKTAQAYLEVAGAVLDERTAEEYRNVAAGAAILAGIAAADAICGLRLGRLHRGDDHRGAIDLLRAIVLRRPGACARPDRRHPGSQSGWA